MKIRDIKNFFKECDRHIDFPIQVILTGGAAGIIYGVERVTYDIDFEIHFQSKKMRSKSWEKLQKALEITSQNTQITPQYAEDIDRWSSISLPKKESRPFEKIGKIEIRLLEPKLWAIGKLTRYLSSDIGDLVTVLKKSKVSAPRCAELWGTALKMSPPSSAQSTFRRQVEYFFDQYTQEIWGKRTKPEKLKNIFFTAARK